LVAVRNGETKFLSVIMVLDDIWLFSLARSSVSLTQDGKGMRMALRQGEPRDWFQGLKLQIGKPLKDPKEWRRLWGNATKLARSGLFRTKLSDIHHISE
jgi:hypothetical protein